MIKLLLVDFDGVMSKGRFYTGHPTEHKDAFEHLRKTIFMSEDKRLMHDWMRGRISYRSLHRKVAKELGIDPAIYDRALVESVRNMRLNDLMLNTVRKVRDMGVKAALFTDNMDVFDSVTVEHFKLGSHFDAIYSSASHGKLKVEDKSLFMKAHKAAGALPSEVALVDDSERSVTAITEFGGHAFRYLNYIDDHDAFERWLFSKLVKNRRNNV